MVFYTLHLYSAQCLTEGRSADHLELDIAPTTTLTPNIITSKDSTS